MKRPPLPLHYALSALQRWLTRMRDRRGSYGRMIAKAYKGVRMLNEELPRARYAEVCTRF